MGFPERAIAFPLVKGGVKTPPAKWLRLLDGSEKRKGICNGENPLS
jgi:hypothetical protein